MYPPIKWIIVPNDVELNIDRIELILVPNDVECSLVFKDLVVSSEQKYTLFYISNQFISNQGSGFLKITIEYNGLLLC